MLYVNPTTHLARQVRKKIEEFLTGCLFKKVSNKIALEFD